MNLEKLSKLNTILQEMTDTGFIVFTRIDQTGSHI